LQMLQKRPSKRERPRASHSQAMQMHGIEGDAAKLVAATRRREIGAAALKKTEITPRILNQMPQRQFNSDIGTVFQSVAASESANSQQPLRKRQASTPVTVSRVRVSLVRHRCRQHVTASGICYCRVMNHSASSVFGPNRSNALAVRVDSAWRLSGSVAASGIVVFCSNATPNVNCGRPGGHTVSVWKETRRCCG
jgi:hypothetical protein